MPKRADVLANPNLTAANLNSFFQQAATTIKQSNIDRVELWRRLAGLQSILDERDAEEMNTPITNWNELKQRLVLMKSASKRGDFNPALKQSWAALKTFLDGLSQRELHEHEREPEYWKARTLLYELNDVFEIDDEIRTATFKSAGRVFKEVKELSSRWDRLPQLSHPQTSREFRTLVREKVFFCQWYGEELKRQGDVKQAGKIFSQLLEFTETKLKETQMECFGTRAAIVYGLATVCRRQEDHQLAQDYYTKAVDLYFERAKSRDPYDYDDSLFTTRRIAMCIGLGFGRINFALGNLRRAENALTTARAMLARNPKSLVDDYIKFLYGSIKRCRASKPKEIDDAINNLEIALAGFQSAGHKRYEARVAKELALAHNLRGNYGKALSYVQTVEDFAKQENNLTAQVDAYVLRSRIYRNQHKLKEALKEADDALELIEKSDKSEKRLPNIDALIARGEALLYLADDPTEPIAAYGNARKNFEDAQSMLLKTDSYTGERQSLNAKISTVCELRIAHCYAKAGRLQKAEYHFAMAKRWRKNVEHKWIQKLVEEVSDEINKPQDLRLILSPNDKEPFNRVKRFEQVQRWIVENAYRRAGGIGEAAKLTGLSRTTFSTICNTNEVQRLRVGRKGRNGKAQRSKK